MRILHCLRAPVGGLFRHVLDLAGEQARLGHEVGILCDSNAQNALTGTLLAAIAPRLALGIEQVPMSRKPGLGDISAARAVTSHARHLKLDVLHGHGAKGGAYARLARRKLRSQGQHVKSFYTPHGGTLNFRPGTLQAAFFMSLERSLETFTDGLIFESAYAARVYRDRVGDGGAPQRVIPNGLQPSDFFVPARADAKDFLFVGELRDVKGVSHLLTALADLKEQHGNVSAAIVGSGPDQVNLKKQAEDLGLAAQIIFTGALPVRRAFELGRIMVIPSLAESFPYIVLEAAAAGFPLITTHVGGIPEIVDGTDTQLVAPGDPRALAAAMREALADTDAAQARAGRLKNNVGAKFTVAGMTQSVLDFYAH